MKNIKLPYRYDYVGSFLRPNDLKKIRADYEAGKTTYEALKEAEDTAIRDLVANRRRRVISCSPTANSAARHGISTLCGALRASAILRRGAASRSTMSLRSSMTRTLRAN